MVTPVLGTLSYKNAGGFYNAHKIRSILNNWDIKDWIVGLETGKKGYKHYQIRFDLSGDYDRFFEWCKFYAPDLHLEKASASTYETDYERKGGFYACSRDTPEIRSVRFGRANHLQRDMLGIVDSQNDRQVDVWLDPKGCHGKSWLTIHLWERGEALVVPRSAASPDKLSAFICSAYKEQPYIIIDLPRAAKIPPAIYETIEEVKDGLVFDHRYSGKTRNIRGAKVIVFTNKALDIKKLSKDRWRLHGVEWAGDSLA